MKYCFFCLLVILFSCSQGENTMKLKGSDTEVNLVVQLAESFHRVNPKVFVSISGGGSGLGIASLFNGTADLANSSRRIHADELELFQHEDIRIDSFIFAQDAIAIVVSKDLHIDSICPADLSLILKGDYPNWLPLTGKNQPVNIYGRQSNSGTHDYVKNKLGIEFSPYAKQMNGNAQILEAIRADNSGIGYVGAGYVIHGGNNGIKVLPIYGGKNTKAISPLDAKMIADGRYFFQRPLYQYFKAASYGKVKPFLEFEKSDAGQYIIQLAGYYPVK